MTSVDDQLLGTPSSSVPTVGGPPRDAVRKAVASSRERDPGGSVMKVLYLDDKGDSVGEWASSQIPENPWDGQTMGGLQEPPYRLEQMTFLAEMHPVHSAALEQKTADICGKGWEWEALNDAQAEDADRDLIEAWFQSLSQDDEDMQEVISSVWLDVETLGWGLMECARSPDGELKRAYHVPGHTVRAHRNGFSLCQVRDSRKVWFRRWGATDMAGNPVQVDAKTGSLTTIKTPANDMFVIRRNARRSTWYGIPGYVSAIGWLTLAMAARDDNLLFFANRREPRWAIILTGLSDDPDLEEDLRRAFTVDLKQPYRNLIVPISGPGKVDFQKLSDTQKDGSFDKLSDRADKAIMVGHRIPAGRIANAAVGPLGGNNTVAENRIYKDAVVNPAQELIDSRLNKFIAVEYALATGKTPAWKLKMDDLDVSSEREDLDYVVIAFHGDMITLREARHRLRLGPLMKPVMVTPEPTEPVLDPETGLAPVDPATGLPVPPVVAAPVPLIDEETGNPVEEESPYNDMLFSELPGAGGQAGPAGPGVPPGTGGLNVQPKLGSREDALLGMMYADVADLLTTARDTHENLENLAARQAARDRDGLA